MPKCVNCGNLLPPDFLELTDDGLAKKCVFCIRGVNEIEYFSESENRNLTTTKTEIMNEYQEFLKELDEMPSISSILDAIKDRY